jgi:cysteine-rich repeat protein
MRGKKTLVAAIFSILSGLAACSEFAGIEPGQALFEGACSSDGDCVPDVPDCRAVVGCRDGACLFIDSAQGTPLPAKIQAEGDCAQIVCDGHGGVEILIDTNDADDQNPCTDDRCVGAVVSHDFVESVPCYTGPIGTRGRGLCADGVQHCQDGAPLDGCVGEVLPREESCISSLDEDCDGEANEDGEGCACVPGMSMPCYTGPAGTLDVGICHGGMQTCKDDGLGYATCTGQTLPSPETCGPAAIDENCNNQVNEQGAGCTCGDGWLSVGEECDDGNDVETDACTSICAPPACGDGFLYPGEQCDDGNDVETDTCTSACAPPFCGDGFLQPNDGEVCDDGNQSDDPCLESCQPAPRNVCGGEDFSCAVFADGRIKCWGANYSDQLGTEETSSTGDEIGEMGAALPVTDLGGSRAIDVVVGLQHTCALLENHSVRCWGSNDYAQLGLGAVDLGTGETAIAISAGNAHTCALLESGAVKCWGYNEFGWLGLGDMMDRGTNPEQMGDALPAVDLGAGEKVIAISAGQSHTCALLASGAVKCWGSNEIGQLGLGDVMDRGKTPGEMGDALPAVDLGTGTIAVAISAGSSRTCAVLQGGAMKCWGFNVDGVLGLGDVFYRGDEPGEMGDALPAVDLGTGKTAVAASVGGWHTCALLGGGQVKCWGNNEIGNLGLGDTSSRGGMPGEMGDALPAVDLGTGNTAIAVATRLFGRHTCAILHDKSVKCWGYNEYGQLGLGDAVNRGDATGQMGDALPAVTLW